MLNKVAIAVALMLAVIALPIIAFADPMTAPDRSVGDMWDDMTTDHFGMMDFDDSDDMNGGYGHGSMHHDDGYHDEMNGMHDHHDTHEDIDDCHEEEGTRT